MRNAAIFALLCATLAFLFPPRWVTGPAPIPLACATAEPGGDVTCYQPRPDGRRVVLAASLPTATHSAEDGATVDPAPPRAGRPAEPLPEWLGGGILQWEAEIRQAARETGLDPLALAILASIECPSGNPNCRSYAGALGIGQIMPGTAVSIQGQTGYPCVTMATDPLVSLKCGAHYFAQGLRLAADLWQPGIESAALGASGRGYNGGHGVIPGVVAYAKQGGHVCDAPGPAESRKWCNMMVDRWAQAGRN